MLYPIFGMIVLTFAVLLVGLGARINAVRAGHLTPDSFRLNPTNGASEEIVKTTRHFSNLFEMPVLFYLACVLCLILDLSSQTLIAFAWLYVLARVIHAVIHITYNNVTHRLVAIAASNFALIGIWGIIAANTIKLTAAEAGRLLHPPIPMRRMYRAARLRRYMYRDWSKR